jgi:hypothetical protein
MILPPQSQPVIRTWSPPPVPKQTILTLPDGRRMTLCEAVYRGEPTHRDPLRCVR